MSVSTADWLPALALGIVPLATLLVDRLVGEPPVILHPVVGMGRLLDALGRRLPSGPPTRAFVTGALAWLSGALIVVVIAVTLQGWLSRTLPESGASGADTLWWAVGVILLLKPMLSLRLLLDEAIAVERALARSLEAGRARTARICSRDTGTLGAVALRETAIESVAENLVDSVVAPLFWFAVAGLPGAALYRWANTADAMWGYRDPPREWSGKFAARVDDVLSWVPARLAAVLLSPPGQGDALRAGAARTPSPNGGWPMTATALRLGIRLGKPGVYVLNEHGRDVVDGDIERAVSLVRRAAWQSAVAAGVLAGAFAVIGRMFR